MSAIAMASGNGAASETDRNLARARELFDAFDVAVSRAEAAYRKGQYDTASALAGVAAIGAMGPHAGFFGSPRLETLLLDIGRRTARSSTWQRKPDTKIRRVLHVASELLPVGGLINNLVHWLQADTGRTHSLAAIHQRGDVPANVVGPVKSSGGAIYRINRTQGHQVAWARKLREIAQGYDAVVLHTYGQDPVPLMAFAEPDKRPPLLLLNHADHLFWLGASIADVVINMREAAQDLTIARRGVEPRRNIVVPTVISPPKRVMSREDARAKLGIAPETILIFSAARAMKYRTVDGVTFAAPFVQLLKKHPNAHLLVLGAGDREDWRADSAAVGGRIRGLPESPEARIYHEAADIYVDSFPFVSSTSMMEAAGLGVPLVSKFYGPTEARIFAINHPGIDKPTLHAATEREYIDNIDRLISDPALRTAKGREALESVLHYHTPPSWMSFVERAYALAEELPPVDSASVFAADARETFQHGEPDRSLYEIFGFSSSKPDDLMKGVLGILPLGERIGAWSALRKSRAFANGKDAFRALLPNWLVRRLSDRT